MKKESIRTLLETICEYNNVRITQTFTKENIDHILVKCVPHTQVLELTYLQTGAIEHYQSVTEAAEVIHLALYSSITA